MDEELILFSTTNAQGNLSAVENLVSISNKNLEFDDQLAPQLSGARVLAPVMVFKEGDYVTLRRNGTPVPFKADRARMERWLANTLRDSPINYDHKRTEGPNDVGWLRVSSGKSYLKEDVRDGKLALWVQPEFGPEALSMIQNGRYRDMSIEIDQQTESIVGLGLTNHPRVKNITQFSEVLMPEDKNDIQTQAPVLSEADKEKLAKFDEMQSAFDTLKARTDQLEADRKAEKEAADKLIAEAQDKAQRAEFSDWVQDNLIKDKDGKTAIPVALKDQVVEVLMFAHKADEGVRLFSDTDKAATPVDGIKALFSQLERVEVLGSALEGVQLDNPAVKEEDNGFDLVGHIKTTRGQKPDKKEK